MILESAPIWHEDTQTLIFKEVCPIALAADDSFEEDDLVIVTDPEAVLSGRFSKGALFIDDVLIRNFFSNDLEDGGPVKKEGEVIVY